MHRRRPRKVNTRVTHLYDCVRQGISITPWSIKLNSLQLPATSSKPNTSNQYRRYAHLIFRDPNNLLNNNYTYHPRWSSLPNSTLRPIFHRTSRQKIAIRTKTAKKYLNYTKLQLFTLQELDYKYVIFNFSR